MAHPFCRRLCARSYRKEQTKFYTANIPIDKLLGNLIT